MSLAVTVLGHDRPGIIADVTAALAALGGNLEDSSMTLLRGHFAWTLVVAGPQAAEVERELAPLASEGLVVTVLPLPAEQPGAAPAATHVVSVHGGDRPGIVSSVTRVVADAGGNVIDLTTRLVGGLYVVIAEIDLPRGVDADALAGDLRRVGRDLGVEVTLRAEDTDVL